MTCVTGQEHTDYEVFTILLQDEVEGLEVRNLSGKCKYQIMHARISLLGIAAEQPGEILVIGIKAKHIPGTLVIK